MDASGLPHGCGDGREGTADKPIYGEYLYLGGPLVFNIGVGFWPQASAILYPWGWRLAGVTPWLSFDEVYCSLMTSCNLLCMHVFTILIFYEKSGTHTS